jgi:protein TonB
MKWLNKYMVYPRICMERKQSGKVIVAFIVEPTGEVTDIRIVDGKIRELNHEVLRVLQTMPKWIPGKRNGKPIRSQVTLPVEFEFDDQPFS